MMRRATALFPLSSLSLSLMTASDYASRLDALYTDIAKVMAALVKGPCRRC